MRWRTGSFPWLLAHDLRLSARNFAAQFSGRSRFRLAAFLIAVAVGVHLAAFSAAQWLDEVAKRPGGEAQVELWFAAGVAMTFSLIVAQSMVSAMRVLSSRGDFDLLFSSPVNATAVLGSRAFAIAFEGAATAAMLLLPLANAGAWLGHPRWLALYPVLLSNALAGAGLGLGLAMLFLIALGPRRGRTLLQVAATLIIACCALAGQAISVLPAGVRVWLSRAVGGFSPSAFSDHASWIWLPVRAARGELAAIALWLLFCAALFFLAIQICGLGVSRAVALAGAVAPAAARERPRRPFRRGAGPAMRTKELRLIWRDPWLLSQVLLQVVFVFPVSIALWRNGGVIGSPAVAFAPSIVIVAAQLAGTLAWVTLSGEDAPDFLASAPVTRRAVERRKIEAIALPIALILAAPLLGLALVAPKGALFVAVFACGAALSTALLNLWWQAPARRTMVMRRYTQSRLLGFIELFVTLLWAVGSAVANMGSWGASLPLGMAAIVLWLNRPRVKRA
jgi:ABC-2 type transport system permease protein